MVCKIREISSLTARSGLRFTWAVCPKRNYNLWMTPDSLLFEFGTNGNTLEEAKYTARLVAPILADYLLEEKKD